MKQAKGNQNIDPAMHNFFNFYNFFHIKHLCSPLPSILHRPLKNLQGQSLDTVTMQCNLVFREDVKKSKMSKKTWGRCPEFWIYIIYTPSPKYSITFMIFAGCFYCFYYQCLLPLKIKDWYIFLAAMAVYTWYVFILFTQNIFIFTIVTFLLHLL